MPPRFFQIKHAVFRQFLKGKTPILGSGPPGVTTLLAPPDQNPGSALGSLGLGDGVLLLWCGINVTSDTAIQKFEVSKKSTKIMEVDDQEETNSDFLVILGSP